MPDSARIIVTNTTPLIALAVGVGSLDILNVLYDRVVVPREVDEELHAAGDIAPGVIAVFLGRLTSQAEYRQQHDQSNHAHTSSLR